MKRTMLILLLVVALLGMSAGVAWAISSPNHQITANTLQGGGAGGGIARSTGYTLSMTLGSGLQVSNASASFGQCNGFLCRMGNFLRRVFLPLLMR